MSNSHDVRGVSPPMGSNNSNSDLSSPPRSSPELDDIQIRNDANSITVNQSSGAASTSEKPTRKKAVRKPRIKAGDASSATNTDAPKTKRVRKPRDPNAPPSARSRKSKATPSENTNGGESSRQTKITDAPGMHLSDVSFSAPATPPVQNAMIANSGQSEVIPKSFFNSAPPQPKPQVPPPQQVQQQISQPQSHVPIQQPQPQSAVRTSGQNYDPIRSNYDPVRETLVSHHSYNNSQGSPIPPQVTNRASASPSIASLVDPPNQPLTSPSAHSFLMHQQRQQDGHTSLPASPIVNRLGLSAMSETNSPRPFAPTPTLTSQPMPAPTPPTAPIVLAQKEPQVFNGNSNKKIAINGVSGTSTPKPPAKGKEKEKEKEILLTPPPLPGSGLMGLGGNDGTETRAPTIVLDIPLNGDVNVYVNFARTAEEKYGWDALHPRLAAQRDRLARVAAAGAALERNGSNKESGDEMSLDSEGEGSNVEMGGMSDGRVGTDSGARKTKAAPKRKTKEDEYDKDDGFVDDSEMIWEEQAAAVNDGFFVYSGPLVREGEKPTLERGEGPAKKPRVRKPKAATGEKATTSRVSTGGKAAAATSSGAGSRGGNTAARKARITKADRARMEQEKLEREQMGSMAGMPGGYNTIQLAPSLGGTPMVFNQ
ncbi:hypothetical protein BOTNAR_0012g00020 [Botryotinia narcissicola]|uniref:Hpc2-related domain-containing protein n=1 Tax=Botryotinia narcissicola TaxID=278944 RepID=A0A4Z1J6G4_9HELO|nr:hypothetical protein BOTNAR_0012g00020 [Botryotinia narcissicola]